MERMDVDDFTESSQNSMQSPEASKIMDEDVREEKVVGLVRNVIYIPPPPDSSIQVPPTTKPCLESRDGDLILSWKVSEKVYYRCSYHVTVYQHQKRSKELMWTDVTQKLEYRFPKEKYSPIKKYLAGVVAQKNGTQYRSKEKRSTEKMLCEATKKQKIFYDPFQPLKEDKDVFIGYMKSRSAIEDKVAVKIVDNKNLREIDNFLLLKENPMENVVAYRDWDKLPATGRSVAMAMELCDTNTLQDMVLKGCLKGKYGEMKKVLLHIMRGLSYIHDKTILHRDLKPSNVLRSRDGRTMKISDLGHAKQMTDDQSVASKSGTHIGTLGWGSPEHYDKDAKDTSKKSDIFTAGLIFYYVLSEGRRVYGEKSLWDGIAEIADRKTELILQPLDCQEQELALDLIHEMLKKQEDDRPSSKEVLRHPFFWTDRIKLDFIHAVSRYIQQILKASRETGGDSSALHQQILRDIEQLGADDLNWCEDILKSGKLGADYLSKKAKGEIRPSPNYNLNSVAHLIRFIRNTEEHYTENKEFAQYVGHSRSNIWPYFSSIFPKLLPRVFRVFHENLTGRLEELSELNDVKSLLTYEAPYEPLESFEGVPPKKIKMM